MTRCSLAIGDLDSLAGTEPVISLIVNGVAKAYLLQILTRHEIVNDVIGGVPVAVIFCPLCNTAIVFERTVGIRSWILACPAICAISI